MGSIALESERKAGTQQSPLIEAHATNIQLQRASSALARLFLLLGGT
jgi:hypothetical protein